MSDKFLHRDDAPFSAAVWTEIDKIVVAAASSQLSGRRLLAVKGPFGLGLKAVSGGDKQVDEKTTGKAVMMAGQISHLIMISSQFSVPIRDIAAFEQSGLPIDLSAAADAAIDCAVQEDKLIFNGSDSTWTKGLLNAEGALSYNLKSWNELNTAVEDIIQAATLLDRAGFHGPYALGLAADLYNQLFRRYPEGNMTIFEHVRQIVTDGIYKIPAIHSGGLLLCSKEAFAHILLGQDLMTAFIGPAPHEYTFAVSETLALRLLRPESVCVLRKT
ncbi:MAG: bacteriocin family protein [Planctomycetaceae bacterium]|nr:bacteriocin family protein [Planctomycetaceae bacterium]